MHIFLDDERKPSDVSWVELPNVDWKVVRNFKEFKTLLSGLDEPPEFITFDHDLADWHYQGDFRYEKTGYDCAKELVDICLLNDWSVPPFAVHSLNPTGKHNIKSFLDWAAKKLKDDAFKS